MVKRIFMTACLLLLAGCFSPNNTDSLREHTADATAAAKRDAGAIARGIAEGLTRKGPLNINEASVKQLATLPGVTPDLAQRIINGRPYTATPELVKRRILSKSEFNRVRAQIKVNLQ